MHFDISFYWADMQGMSDAALDELKSTPEKPKPGCKGELSSAPSEWFGKITDKFCKEIDNLAHLGPEDMVYVVERVDKVYHISPELWPPKKRSASRAAAAALAPGLDTRSPPESEEVYKDYKFVMFWYPVKDFEKAKCLLPKQTLCKDAYSTLVRSNCKSKLYMPHPHPRHQC